LLSKVIIVAALDIHRSRPAIHRTSVTEEGDAS